MRPELRYYQRLLAVDQDEAAEVVEGKCLRARCPDLKIIVGRWGRAEDPEVRSLLLAAGADNIASTLIDTCHQIQLLSLLASPAGSDADRVVELNGRS